MGPLVRLACLRHAASVHPEPGSNSHKKRLIYINHLNSFDLATQFLDILLSFQRSICTEFGQCICNISNIRKRVNIFFDFFYTFFKFDIYIDFLPSKRVLFVGTC